jgi:hypothetical protein
MDERRRFQFSIGNLMLAMVPLGVVFGIASLAREAGWAVWLVAISAGIGPAIGALVGGWDGMGRGFGWFLIASMCAYASAFMVMIWSCIFTVIFTGSMHSQTWSVCAALLLVSAGPVIGGMKRGWKGVLNGLAVGMAVMMAMFFVVLVGIVAVVLVRERLLR